jgi:hypothetical protein
MRPANKTKCASLATKSCMTRAVRLIYIVHRHTGNLLARSPAASSPLASHSHTCTCIYFRTNPADKREAHNIQQVSVRSAAHIPTFVTHSRDAFVRVSKASIQITWNCIRLENRTRSCILTKDVRSDLTILLLEINLGMQSDCDKGGYRENQTPSFVTWKKATR